MTIIVTGGAGFIGTHLVKRLEDGGKKVFVLDDYSRGKCQGFPPCDVTINADCYQAFVAAQNRHRRPVSEVIHLAFINGTKTFYERPYDVLEVATRGMWNVLDQCKRFNVRKFILMSSSEVCRAKLIDADEAIPLVIPDPFNPRYSYSAGKIISEMMAIHCGLFDRLLIARPFNIYGPGMSPGHVIPDFIEQARRAVDRGGPPFEIIGTGEETRSFCYIDDFIDGFMLMREKGEHRGIYNIGTMRETPILTLAKEILEMAGGDPAWVRENGRLREGDAPRRRPDIAKLAALGYAPKVSLEEGLRRTIGCDAKSATMTS